MDIIRNEDILSWSTQSFPFEHTLGTISDAHLDLPRKKNSGRKSKH